jgi:hypothetical protein
MLEQAWFLTFWGTLAILAALEVLIPESPAPAERSRRWPVNLGLAILNTLLASPVPALTVSAAQWADERHIGLLDRISAPAWAAFAITKRSKAWRFTACIYGRTPTRSCGASTAFITAIPIWTRRRAFVITPWKCSRPF